ncbi:putative type IX secretion system sortase PorU2 [Pontibacter roseus]|uniref:putative type IX secretion system sortase PorU2 n=1 Tax=Pontibacter roseus TaxID=336989 RepID=UPI00035E73B2|nr:C25 family cysteine peptidase [Pontibacter roseus]
MNIYKLYRHCLFTLILVAGAFAAASAQSPTPYGNEWIDYSKTYYKLKVVNTGLHRLSHGYLDSLGLAGVNPQHFQLFRRGQEVAIHVAGEADGRLDRQDFIEFYGERNDGRLDQDLYKNPAHQPHQLYSLYTDTAAYFLTVNSAGGKRMREVNPAIDGRTPEPYHLQKVVSYYVDRYYNGKVHGDALLSWMDEGEGYSSTASRVAKNYDVNAVVNLASSGPKPILEYAVGGVNSNSHGFAVNLVPPAGGVKLLSRFQIEKDGFAKGKSTLEFSDISSQGKVTIQTVPDATPSNDVTFSYGKLTFPQITSFTGSSMFFHTDSTRASNPYFEFTGASESVVSYDVTDSNNPVRIAGRLNGQNKGFVIPTEFKSHKVLLASTVNAFKPRGRVDVVKFRSIAAEESNYIIITNRRLMKVAAGAQNSAPVEYAAYRASAVGGGYDTLLLHVDQVVNQFHYGEFSSNAIRKFMEFMLTSERPKHLFLIGKGMKYAAPSDFRSVDNSSSRNSLYHVGNRYHKAYEIDLVPTGMMPSSDIFFTADFRNHKYEPRVPTGRLPVTDAEQILAYLNKVKEYDAVPEGLAWRKNILQLGGGSNVNQMNKFANWLTIYKNIAEGPFLGANVLEKYRKSVSETVTTINVSEEVNEGLSLMTFFGHSSATTSDLDVGFASININGYRNKGKYPVILMNGCATGDAFIYNYKSFGEDWLLTPDRGAISFIAHSHTGGDNPLNDYSRNYYQTAFSDANFYGRTIGEIQKEAVRRLNTTHSSDGYYVATMTQMVLQGDPAVKPYAPSKPDYTFDNNLFVITDSNGEVATSESENLLLQVNINNFGKAIPDSVDAKIKRTLAGNAIVESGTIRVKPILKKDQLQLILPNLGTAAAGMNSFEIELDNTYRVNELKEDNNLLRIQHFLPSSGISALAPMEYSIVKNSRVSLVVQSTQLGAEPKGVYFEMDTTHGFNSALKRSYNAGTGVVRAWDVELPLLQPGIDSTVFYWRARFDSFAPGEDTVWVQSSFRYISNSIGGWSQSHTGQFGKAKLEGINYEEKYGTKWNFNPLYANIELRTVGGDVRYSQPPYGIFLNGHTETNNACGNFEGSSAPRMYFVVLDNVELSRKNVPGMAGCSWMPFLYQFGDLNNPTVRSNLQKFLAAVPEGYYVFGISINKVPFELFTPELKAAFKSIGSGIIDELKTGYPYAIIGQKGAAPGTAKEATAKVEGDIAATSQEVTLTTVLQTREKEGTVTSTIIGPALSWGSLHHNIERYGAGNDSYKLSLYGVNAAGQRNLLAEDIKEKVYNLANIKAEEYPSLQLMATLTDTEARTAPQLKQWMVYYEAAPEGVIRPDLVEVSDDIVTEQASRGMINMPMAFQNITPYAFRDSLTVEVTVTGEGIEPMVSRFKIGALEGNKTTNFSFSMPTSALDGSYKLSMYVNPRLQPEQQYQNNIYEVNFAVKSKLHPIMDVAFDGVHIMDGELVSPSPLISIMLKDENKHAFLQNADAMEVYLTDGRGNTLDVKQSAKPNEMRVYPADEKNDFRFEYKPERLENGRYTLEVKGKDVTGKDSGVSPYRISFEVENESKITNFYPYPNPFSSKTQFIFTLTGAVIPQDFKIQIMTVTGKVVKEIMREEIGPIRIGNNKTEYAWDGTDTFGDKLANGVYLYRVVMPQGTEEMKHNWKKGDKAFVNGYGKVYILR